MTGNGPLMTFTEFEKTQETKGETIETHDNKLMISITTRFLIINCLRPARWEGGAAPQSGSQQSQAGQLYQPRLPGASPQGKEPLRVCIFLSQKLNNPIFIWHRGPLVPSKMETETLHWRALMYDGFTSPSGRTKCWPNVNWRMLMTC